jgi:hypothetical protein
MDYGGVQLEAFTSILLGENASTFCPVLCLGEQEHLTHMTLFGILQVNPMSYSKILIRLEILFLNHF